MNRIVMAVALAAVLFAPSSSILSDGNAITNSDIVFQFLGVGEMAVYTAGNNPVGYYKTLGQGGTLTPCCAT